MHAYGRPNPSNGACQCFVFFLRRPPVPCAVKGKCELGNPRYVDGISMLPAKGVDFNTILSGSNVILTKLNFDIGKSTIRSESFEQLDKFAAWLKNHSDIGVSIDGHTDKQGSDELNMALSKNRADAVKKYLVDQKVSGDKLFTRGYGETQPLDKGSQEDSQKNRRVEISLRK